MEDIVELKSYFLPVISTRGFVYFPSNDVKIDVARDFSLNALEFSKSNFDSYVIIVSQINPAINNVDLNNLYKMGVLAQIKNINSSRNGINTLKVELQIIDRVNIKSFDIKDNCIFASGEEVKEIVGEFKEEVALVKRLSKLVEDSSDLFGALPKGTSGTLLDGVSASVLADTLANYMILPVFKKQQILETLNINDRIMQIIMFLEEEKYAKEIDKEIDNKVRKRIEENQKEYILRERLKAIKEELGEDYNKDEEINAWKAVAQDERIPENIRNRLLEEIKKYEIMPNMSQEAMVIRGYVDWLVNLPWYQMDEGEQDFNKIEQVLNESHYGLEKIKERILEYLAVQKLVNYSKSTILCFAGAPGVGKTSLALSIAKALGRKYVKMSLGGVSDEAEIRGHRRTYVGAIPGRIIQGMKKAGVINPVFVLDEIDKIGQNAYKGDPSSALLEVLDPEQNKIFSDNYLEEPYDLSKVVFIATANNIETIPAPLRDRLEIIRLSSYTEIEKLNIAKKHLYQKQLKENGLTEKNLEFSDEALLHIIRYYTMESGVRQLEREIGTICRKVAVKVLKMETPKKIKISVSVVNKYLGKEKFDYTKKEKTNQVGVVTGLAYTDFGGDILNVEVTTFEGKGRTILTGSLGDVMKESADIALDYVKANAKKYGITTDFERTDIHIHFPEGAVPKDGPSAGVTMTTAIVSALTNTPVNKDVAMTGEITLRGNVLPIGGLKEKSISALRSGISTIIIPKENERDLDEIPQEVKEKLTIKFADSIDTVLNIALTKEVTHNAISQC